MPRRTKEVALQTREKILEGALHVFSEKGFSRSTLDDIAKHIGMTKGALYWHFKDKQEILAELMDTIMKKEEVLINAIVPSVVTLDDLLSQLMARAQLMEENSCIRKFVYFMTLQVEWATETRILSRVREDKLRRMPFRKVHEVLNLVRERGELRPEIDIELAYDIIVGLFTGMMRNSMSGIAETPLAAGLRPALEAIFDHIRVKPQGALPQNSKDHSIKDRTEQHSQQQRRTKNARS